MPSGDSLLVLLSSPDHSERHDCASVSCGGQNGFFQILPNHMNMSVNVGSGRIDLVTGSGRVLSFDALDCVVTVVDGECTIVGTAFSSIV